MSEPKKYSATELVELGLNCLPTTVENTLKKAKREGWAYVEVPSAGRFGLKRLYEVPDYVLDEIKHLTKVTHALKGDVLPVITPNSKVDPVILEKVVKTLNFWLQSKNLTLEPDRYAALVSVLYDYIAKGANQDDLNQFFKAVA